MKKFAKIGLVMILVIAMMYYLLFGNPVVNWHNRQLEDAMERLTAGTITLEEIVPFQWDRVYTFDAYTSRSDIVETIGFDSPAIKETVSEYMTQLIFVKDDKIVSSICKYPDSAGFYINLWDARSGKLTDGGYAYLEYGDDILFTVEKKEGYNYLKVAERGTTETFISDELEVQE